MAARGMRDGKRGHDGHRAKQKPNAEMQSNNPRPHTPMTPSQTLRSILRHLLTFLAGLGTLLAARAVIAPEDAAAVNEAGAQLIEPVALILGAAGAALARLLLALFQRGGGKTGPLVGTGLPAAGGLLLAGSLAGFVGFSLPSCSPAQLETARNIPIKACYIDEAGNSVCYGSKSGLELSVDRRSGK